MTRTGLVSSAERTIGALTVLLESWRFPILIVLSVLYFWTTAFQAERKLYWFDEICTVQISSLPNLGHIWTALTHGADFNPPLIYLLTGFSQHVLSNSSLATRLPEIIAFWVLCLSLYVFTYRIAGAPGALTAFLFPLVTIAQWYSYEARPHALVLGFAGLAAVCWQGAQLGKHRPWWLIGLGLSLGLILLSHAFGLVVFFPIALAEIVDFSVTRRFRPGAWIAMLCGGSALVVSFILLQALKADHSASLAERAHLGMIDETYSFILQPAAMTLILAFCAVLLGWRRLTFDKVSRATLPQLALIAGFVLIPFVSYVLAFVTRGPLNDRYSLEAVFGFACLVGMAAAMRPLMALVLPVVMLLAYEHSVSAFSKLRQTLEPTMLMPINTTFEDYAKRYHWITDAGDPNLPVVLIDDLDFSPTIHYAPAALQSRMIFGWKLNGGFDAKVYSRLIQFTGAPGRVMPLEDVVRTYPAFLLLATSRQGHTHRDQDDDVLHELLPTVHNIKLLDAQGDTQLMLVTARQPD